MMTVWERVNIYKTIYSRIVNSLAGEDWDNIDVSFMERKKLEIILIMKVLAEFNIDFSEMSIPCTTRKPIDNGPCEEFQYSKDTSMYCDFETFYDQFFTEAYKALGWTVHNYPINNDWFDCIEYDDKNDITEFNEELICDKLGNVTDDVPSIMFYMLDYMLASNIVIEKYFILSNEQLGNFLRFAEKDEVIQGGRLYQEVMECVEKIKFPLNISFNGNMGVVDCMHDGSFAINYYLFNDRTTNEGITSLNYEVCDILYTCILKLLLEEAYTTYKIA